MGLHNFFRCASKSAHNRQWEAMTSCLRSPSQCMVELYRYRIGCRACISSNQTCILVHVLYFPGCKSQLFCMKNPMQKYMGCDLHSRCALLSRFFCRIDSQTSNCSHSLCNCSHSLCKCPCLGITPTQQKYLKRNDGSQNWGMQPIVGVIERPPGMWKQHYPANCDRFRRVLL